MAIRNLMEDVISSVVNEVLIKEKNNLPENITSYKDDIITYVLNRVTPKYFSSERGILHNKLESECSFQQKADILLYIYEAIKIIQLRRPPEEKQDKLNFEINKRFLPHILGEVFDESSFAVVPDIEVMLLHNNQPAKMMDSTWKNPYITNNSTVGYYHFWPVIPDDKTNDNSIMFNIVFTHPLFEEKKFECTLNIMTNVNSYKSFIMPITLLKSKMPA